MKVIYSWQQPTKKAPLKSKIKLLIKDIAKFANLSTPDGSIISFIFLPPKAMIKINNSFLSHNYLTDVICFPYFHDDMIEAGESALDIFISPDIAEERASENKKLTYASEIVLYMVHGILHATGMLDSTDQQKKEMRTAESIIISQLLKFYDFNEIFPS